MNACDYPNFGYTVAKIRCKRTSFATSFKCKIANLALWKIGTILNTTAYICVVQKWLNRSLLLFKKELVKPKPQLFKLIKLCHGLEHINSICDYNAGVDDHVKLQLVLDIQQNLALKKTIMEKSERIRQFNVHI